jgi:hypothetical protein
MEKNLKQKNLKKVLSHSFTHTKTYRFCIHIGANTEDGKILLNIRDLDLQSILTPLPTLFETQMSIGRKPCKCDCTRQSIGLSKSEQIFKSFSTPFLETMYPSKPQQPL